MMTALRPYTLLSVSPPLYHTHTLKCLPVPHPLFVLCLSLSYLYHTPTQTMASCILSPRCKAANRHVNTKPPTHTNTHTRTLPAVIQVFITHTHFFPPVFSLSFRHVIFFSHTHTQTMHYSLRLGILHFDEGGSKSVQSEWQDEGETILSKTAGWFRVSSTGCEGAFPATPTPRSPLGSAEPVVRSFRLHKNPSSPPPPTSPVSARV